MYCRRARAIGGRMSCRREHVLQEGTCLVGGRMSCRREHVL
jgi:hypothetical protein